MIYCYRICKKKPRERWEEFSRKPVVTSHTIRGKRTKEENCHGREKNHRPRYSIRFACMYYML